MLGLGIRNKLKNRVRRWLGRPEAAGSASTAAPASAPAPVGSPIDADQAPAERPAPAPAASVAPEPPPPVTSPSPKGKVGPAPAPEDVIPPREDVVVSVRPQAAREAHPLDDEEIHEVHPDDDELVDDTAGQPLTEAAVEAILEELVRPALQADGGDIDLVRIEEGDVYVRLKGSCTSCPSSIATMKLGVERLLQEEFPTMGGLFAVEESAT